MITVQHMVGYAWTLNLDKADVTVVRRLADAYVIPSDDMLVACINKGIEVISKQVQEIDRLKKERHTHGQEEAGG